jgi:hypothetical protein
VPKDFAKVIAAHAQSDMRGVRNRAEHRRALRFCIVLAIAAFALLGATSSKILIFSARSIVDKTFGIVGLIGRTLYDAAAGFTVIARVLSGGLVIDSRVASLTFLVLLALAIGLLSLLISRYHRTRLIE